MKHKMGIQTFKTDSNPHLWNLRHGFWHQTAWGLQIPGPSLASYESTQLLKLSVPRFIPL